MDRKTLKHATRGLVAALSIPLIGGCATYEDNVILSTFAGAVAGSQDNYRDFAIAQGVADAAGVIGAHQSRVQTAEAGRTQVTVNVNGQEDQEVYWRYFSTNKIDSNDNGNIDRHEPLYEKSVVSTNERFYVGMRIRNGTGIKSTYIIKDSKGNEVFGNSTMIKSDNHSQWCVYQPGEAKVGKYSIEWYLEKGSEKKLAIIGKFEVVE